MTLEERITRIEQYIVAASRQDGWLAILEEIRASLDAPRAEAEPAPAERTVEAAITKASAARVAYGDGRVSVWREIEEVLVGSDSDVTKPIPTRIRSLVAEVKRLHTERDEAREERDSLRAQLDECQRVFLHRHEEALLSERAAALGAAAVVPEKQAHNLEDVVRSNVVGADQVDQLWIDRMREEHEELLKMSDAIRSLSPEGWRGVREADLAVVKEAAGRWAGIMDDQDAPRLADSIRAALARLP